MSIFFGEFKPDKKKTKGDPPPMPKLTTNPSGLTKPKKDERPVVPRLRQKGDPDPIASALRPIAETEAQKRIRKGVARSAGKETYESQQARRAQQVTDRAGMSSGKSLEDLMKEKGAYVAGLADPASARSNPTITEMRQASPGTLENVMVHYDLLTKGQVTSGGGDRDRDRNAFRNSVKDRFGDVNPEKALDEIYEVAKKRLGSDKAAADYMQKANLISSGVGEFVAKGLPPTKAKKQAAERTAGLAARLGPAAGLFSEEVATETATSQMSLMGSLTPDRQEPAFTDQELRGAGVGARDRAIIRDLPGIENDTGLDTYMRSVDAVVNPFTTAVRMSGRSTQDLEDWQKVAVTAGDFIAQLAVGAKFAGVVGSARQGLTSQTVAKLFTVDNILDAPDMYFEVREQGLVNGSISFAAQMANQFNPMNLVDENASVELRTITALSLLAYGGGVSASKYAERANRIQKEKIMRGDEALLREIQAMPENFKLAGEQYAARVLSASGIDPNSAEGKEVADTAKSVGQAVALQMYQIYGNSKLGLDEIESISPSPQDVQAVMRGVRQSASSMLLNEPDATPAPSESMTMGNAVDATQPLADVQATPSAPTESPVQQPMNVDSAPVQPSALDFMNPADLKVNPGIQYKSDAKGNATKTSAKFADIDTFNVDQGGVLVVWERADGSREIVHGHHRAELANRAKRWVRDEAGGVIADVEDRNVPVRVLKESEGWDLRSVRVLGAMENMRNGDGRPLDGAMVLHELGVTREELSRDRGISIRGNFGRDIDGLMGLGRNALTVIQRGEVSESVGAGIGAVSGLDETNQIKAMQKATARGISTYEQALQYGRTYRDSVVGTNQDDLFGGAFMGDPITTIDTQFELEKKTRQAILQEYDSIKAGLRADALEGEVINTGLRQDLISQYGKKAGMVAKLGMMFDKFRDMQRLRATLALQVDQGEINEANAVKQLRDAAVEALGAPDRDYVTGRDVAPGAATDGQDLLGDRPDNPSEREGEQRLEEVTPPSQPQNPPKPRKEPKTPKQPEGSTQTRPEPIGKQSKSQGGRDLFVDENGVRYYEENGFVYRQKGQLQITREGIFTTPVMSDEFMTAEEYDAAYPPADMSSMSDEELIASAGDRLGSMELTAEDMAEIEAEPDAQESAPPKSALDQLADQLRADIEAHEKEKGKNWKPRRKNSGALDIEPEDFVILVKKAALLVLDGVLTIRDAARRIAAEYELEERHAQAIENVAVRKIPELQELSRRMDERNAQDQETQQNEQVDEADTQDDQPIGEVSSAQKLVKAVADKLARGESFKTLELDRMADEAFGGTAAQGKHGPRDRYDALEAGVNRYLLDMGSQFGIASGKLERIDWFESLVDKLPTQTERTADQNKMQQFSTPWHEAYTASLAFGPMVGRTVLEPSAGTGNLATIARMRNADSVTVNEAPFPEADYRAALLEGNGFDVTRNDGLLIFGTGRTYDLVFMNPPFSESGGTMKRKDTSFGAQHVQAGLRSLKPGGRLVAIVGHSMGISNPKFAPWYRKMESEGYALRADILVDGKQYRKMGTSYDNRILVFDAAPRNGIPVLVINEPQSLMDAGVALSEMAKQIPVQVQEDGTTTLQPPNSDGSGSGSQSGSQSGKAPRPPRQKGGGLGGSNSGRGGGSTLDSGNAGGAATANNGRSGSNESVSGNSGTTQPMGEPQQNPDGGTGNVPTDPRGNRNRSGDGNTAGESFDTDTQLTELLAEPEPDVESLTIENQYKPAINTGNAHPGILTETASMLSVSSPLADMKPEEWNKLLKYPEMVKAGTVSDAQLEEILLAEMQHQQRLQSGHVAGYTTGAGTGVGKGRIIAGAIANNWAQGNRRIIWLSTDDKKLASAAQDDISDVMGKNAPPFRSATEIGNKDLGDMDGVIMVGYGKIQHSSGGRWIQRLMEWANAGQGSPLIIFDEAHKLANAVASGRKKPSATGARLLALQRDNPNARVLYASATAATNAGEMGYMDRIGLWGPGAYFETFHEFAGFMKSNGLGAYEMLARDLKAFGKYNARQLPLLHPDGTPLTFSELQVSLEPGQITMLDSAAQTWRAVMNAVLRMQADIEEVNGDLSTKQRLRDFQNQYWGAHQRFFKQMYAGLALRKLFEEADVDLQQGKQVVITLDTTNESAMDEIMANAQATQDEIQDLMEIDFSRSQALVSLIEKAFKTQLRQEVQVEEGSKPELIPVWRMPDGTTRNAHSKPSDDAVPVEDPALVGLKNQLLAEAQEIEVPGNPLDLILEHFGKENVAELTGRKSQFETVVEKDGTRKARQIARTKGKNADGRDVNDAEMRRFQNGQKKVAVISRAAAQGISLHASNSAKSKVQRMMYLYDLGWQTKDEVQKLGRVHRTNQAIGPEYKLVTIDVGGSRRFASALANRMASLGALQRGDRGSIGAGSLANYDFNSIYGRAAALRALRSLDESLLSAMNLDDMKDDLDPETVIRKFFNRLMVLPVAAQNHAYATFDGHFRAMVSNARESGDIRDAVTKIKANAIEVTSRETVATYPGGAKTELVTLTGEVPVRVVGWDAISSKQRMVPNSFFALNRNGTIVLGEPFVRLVDDMEVEGWKTTKVNGVIDYHPQPYRSQNLTTLSPEDAQARWNEAVSAMPTSEEAIFPILTGVTLPHLAKLEQVDMAFVQVDTGSGRMLGMKIEPRDLPYARRQLGLTEGARNNSTQQIVQQILAMNVGEAYEIAGGLRLVKTRWRGSPAIAVKGSDLRTPTGPMATRLANLGVLEGNMSYQVAGDLIVPYESDYTSPVLENVLREFPAIGVVDPNGTAELDMLDSVPASLAGQMNATNAELAMAQKEAEVDEAVIKIKPIEGQRPQPLNRITYGLTSSLSIIASRGFARRGRRGSYLARSQSIQLRAGTDLVAAAHEVGHWIDDNLEVLTPYVGNPTTPFDAELQHPAFQSTVTSGMNLAQQRAEQFAEVFRSYISDPDATTAIAPTLVAELKDKLGEDNLRAVDAFSQQVRIFAGAKPLDAAGALFSNAMDEQGRPNSRLHRILKTFGLLMGETPIGISTGDAAYKTRAVDKIRTLVTDQFAPVIAASTELMVRNGYLDASTLNQQPKGFDPEMNPIVRLRRLAYVGEMFQAHVMGNGFTDRNGNVVAGSVREMLETLGDPKNKNVWEQDYRDVHSYMLAQRAMERRDQFRAEAWQRADQYRTALIVRRHKQLKAEYAPAIDKVVKRTNNRIRTLERTVSDVKTRQAKIKVAMSKADADIKAIEDKIKDELTDYAMSKELDDRVEKFLARQYEIADQKTAAIFPIEGGGAREAISSYEGVLADIAKDSARSARFDRYAQHYRAIGNWMLDTLENAGFFSPEQVQVMKDRNEFWFAAQRDMEADSSFDIFLTNSLAKSKNPIRAFKGSQRMVGDPVANLLKNLHSVLTETERNAVTAGFTAMVGTDRKYGQDLLVNGDMAILLEARERGKPSQIKGQPGQTIEVRRNGQIETWQIPNKDLYEALKEPLSGTMNPALRVVLGIVTWPARVTRATIILTPAFAMRNYIRDSFNQWLHNTQGPAMKSKAPAGVQSDFMDRFGVGLGMSEIMQNAGDWNQVLRNMMAELGATHSIVDMMAKPVKGYAHLLEKAEQVNRKRVFVQNYEAATKKGMHHVAASMYAAHEARLAMTDFRRKGVVTAFMGQFIPFFNAAIQGMTTTYSLLRRNKDGASRGISPAQLARMGLYILMMNAAEDWWSRQMGDEEELAERDPIQRVLFYHFYIPGLKRYLLLPKPHEIGMFAAGISRVTGVALGREEADMSAQEQLTAMGSLLIPLTDDNAFGGYQPYVENLMNRDLFRGKEIVSNWEEKEDIRLRDGDQYSSYFSQWLAGVIGESTNYHWGPDPRKIDHWISGQFGNVGRTLVKSMKPDTNLGSVALAATGLSGERPGMFGPSVKFVDAEIQKLGMDMDTYSAVQRIRKSIYETKDEAEKQRLHKLLLEAARKTRDLLKRVDPSGDPKARAEVLKEPLKQMKADYELLLPPLAED